MRSRVRAECSNLATRSALNASTYEAVNLRCVNSFTQGRFGPLSRVSLFALHFFGGTGVCTGPTIAAFLAHLARIAKRKAPSYAA